MFHVLSLQRTASKSLVAVLSQVRDLDAKIQLCDEPLAEFLHYWTKTDFQFAPHLTKPFGHQEDVVYYKTHPKFGDPSNIQFEYVKTGPTDLGYTPVPVDPTKTPVHLLVFRALDLLSSMAPGDKFFVLKTQLAHLLYSVHESLRDLLLKRLESFHSHYEVTTVKLSRRSGLDWLCSMALTDASGIFIPGQAQANALSKFTETPLVVSEENLQAWVAMWNLHETSITADTQLFDTDLKGTQPIKCRRSAFNDRNFSFPPHDVKEFSSVDYRKTIANYEYLQHVSKTLMVRGDE